MKTCNVFLLSILFCLLSSHLIAQTFGIKGGANLAIMLAKDNDNVYSDDFKLNPGFHIGGTVELPIKGILTVEPGLLLTKRGYKSENVAERETQKNSINTYYIDLPVSLKANFDIAENTALSLLLGPYLGCALFGKVKSDVSGLDGDMTYRSDIIIGEELHRFDYGLTFGPEVSFSSFFIGVSYDLGLRDVFPDDQYGTIMKNRLIKVSFGYRFNRQN